MRRSALRSITLATVLGVATNLVGQEPSAPVVPATAASPSETPTDAAPLYRRAWQQLREDLVDKNGEPRWLPEEDERGEAWEALLDASAAAVDLFLDATAVTDCTFARTEGGLSCELHDNLLPTLDLMRLVGVHARAGRIDAYALRAPGSRARDMSQAAVTGWRPTSRPRLSSKGSRAFAGRSVPAQTAMGSERFWPSIAKHGGRCWSGCRSSAIVCIGASRTSWSRWQESEGRDSTPRSRSRCAKR